MNPGRFLLLNLALAFYHVGTIWAHEVDIFRSWRLLDADTFRRVKRCTGTSFPTGFSCLLGLLWSGQSP